MFSKLKGASTSSLSTSSKRVSMNILGLGQGGRKDDNAPVAPNSTNSSPNINPNVNTNDEIPLELLNEKLKQISQQAIDAIQSDILFESYFKQKRQSVKQELEFTKVSVETATLTRTNANANGNQKIGFEDYFLTLVRERLVKLEKTEAFLDSFLDLFKELKTTLPISQTNPKNGDNKLVMLWVDLFTLVMKSKPIESLSKKYPEINALALKHQHQQLQTPTQANKSLLSGLIGFNHDKEKLKECERIAAWRTDVVVFIQQITTLINHRLDFHKKVKTLLVENIELGVKVSVGILEALHNPVNVTVEPVNVTVEPPILVDDEGYTIRPPEKETFPAPFDDDQSIRRRGLRITLDHSATPSVGHEGGMEENPSHEGGLEVHVGKVLQMPPPAGTSRHKSNPVNPVETGQGDDMGFVQGTCKYTLIETINVMMKSTYAEKQLVTGHLVVTSLGPGSERPTGGFVSGSGSESGVAWVLNPEAAVWVGDPLTAANVINRIETAAGAGAGATSNKVFTLTDSTRTRGRDIIVAKYVIEVDAAWRPVVWVSEVQFKASGTLSLDVVVRYTLDLGWVSRVMPLKEGDICRLLVDVPISDAQGSSVRAEPAANWVPTEKKLEWDFVKEIQAMHSLGKVKQQGLLLARITAAGNGEFNDAVGECKAHVVMEMQGQSVRVNGGLQVCVEGELTRRLVSGSCTTACTWVES